MGVPVPINDTNENVERRRQQFRLAAALSYAALIVHGSLLPYTGWTWPAETLSSFLLRPDVATGRSDMVTNFLTYVPLGLLLSWTLAPRRRLEALATALLLGSLLSLCMETMQSFLVTRIASRVDLLTDCCGTLAGATFGRVLCETEAFLRIHARLRGQVLNREESGMRGVAMVALALWAMSQMTPFVPRSSLASVCQGFAPLYHTVLAPGSLSFFALAEYSASTALVSMLIRTFLRRELTGLASVVMVALVLVSKPFIAARVLGIEAIVGAALGLLSAYVLDRVISSQRDIAVIAIFTLTLGFVAAELRPGQGASHPFIWMPFAAEFHNTFDGFDSILATAWVFTALATFVARIQRTPARWLCWSGATIVGAATFLLEWNQQSIPGRVGNTTPALLALVTWAAAWNWITISYPADADGHLARILSRFAGGSPMPETAKPKDMSVSSEGPAD
jgi:hypothetical protein